MTCELHFGDCIEVMRTLPEQTFQLILSDPPYGTTNCAWDSVIPFEPMWEQYRRLLAPGGCVLMFGAMPFTASLAASNPDWYKDHLVWNKNKCGSPGLAKIRPMRVHEDILVFAPGRNTYNPQMEVGEPYSRKSKSEDGYVGRVNRHGYGLRPKTEFENHGTRYPKSILNIPRDFRAQDQIHAAQKPVSLLTWLILTYSNPGDRVLDNSMGSGTTGVAAADVGRHFVGIDDDVESFSTAAIRLGQPEAALKCVLSAWSTALSGDDSL